MTLEELTEYHERLCTEARSLMLAKNTDYSPGDDRFRNFRGAETFGVPAIIGIVVRMQDKLSRLAAYARAGRMAVQSEGVRDTLIDIINYAGLVGAMDEEDRQRASRLSAD